MSPVCSQLVPISEPLHPLPGIGSPRPSHSSVPVSTQVFTQLPPITEGYPFPLVTLSPYPALVFVTALISTENNVACGPVCFLLFCEDRDLTCDGPCCLVPKGVGPEASLPAFKS